MNDLAIVINDFTDNNIKKDYLFYNGQTVEADIDYATSKEMIFHCGGSSKDSGKRVSSISRVEDVALYQNIVGSLEGNPVLKL